MTLSARNNWRHTWDRLPKYDASGRRIEWSVVERDVSGYTVLVSREGPTFVMVIAGHNYSGHFGTLKNLAPGDALSFTDIDGNVFSYTVVELETLPPYAVEEMTSGDWDLTLFTCTVGGQSRLAVRCKRAEATA